MRHSQALARPGWMILVALLMPWAVGVTFAATLQQEFRITKWETEDGLPENSATAMVQTPDGYLWFGTLNGLVRFDGVKFTTFNPLNTPELPGGEIASLYLHPSGRMWISTDKGLASWQNGQWKRHGQNPHWANRVVRSFAGNATGALCATSLDGAVCEIRGEEIIELPKPPVVRAAHAHMDAAGTIWALNEEFAGHWDGQQWVASSATLNLTNSFRCAATARDGGLWVLKQTRLIKVKAGRVTESRPLTDAINQVWAMAEDDAGTLWAAGVRAGLFRIGTNGTVAQYRMQDGLTYNALRFAQPDRERNLWVGTSGGGLMRLRARTFQTFDTEKSLPTRVVRSVWEERPGVMLLGTHGGGARRLEAGGKVSTVLRTKPTEGYIQSVLADRQQRTWISLHNEGLAVLEAGQERRFPPEESGGRRISALFEDTAGRIWIGGNDSVVRFENGQFQRVITDTGKVVSSVRSFAENPRDGSLWAVNERGLFRLAAGKFQPVNGPGDKPLNEGLCLRFEAEGTLWVGTKNLGLLRRQNQTWAALTHHAGLPSDTITSVLEDGLGHFWIASNRGITRAAKTACHAVADGRRTELNAQVFTVSDGLASAECATGVQPNAAPDSQGRLWFATLKGVAVVDPRQVQHNPNPPPLFIERITYRDHHGEYHELPYTRGQREVLAPPGTERLAVYFTGLSYSAPEKMRFSYTTDKSGRRWTDVSDRRMIAVPTPGPGQTQFRLKAANGDGVWNQTDVALAFTVPPFYWQTLWFRVLAGLAVAIGIGGTVWRVQRKELRQQRSELARERTLASERARLAAVLAANHERAVRQRAAVASLVTDSELNAPELGVALRRLTEILSATLQVERASVWLMSDDGREMRCEELFETSPRRHSAGLVLRAADYPRYWLALQLDARVDADDAVSDPRTSEFAAGYLRPLGITSMLDAVLLKDGHVAGVVCLEHTGAARHWEADEQNFANTAAALAAQLLATSERRQAEQRLAAFASLGQRLNAATDVKPAGQLIVEVADELFGWDAATLVLYDAATDLCRPAFNMDEVNGQRVEVSPAYTDQPPTPLLRRVMERGAELTLREESVVMAADAVPFGDVSRPSASLMFVPVRDGQKVIGVLSIQSYRRMAYTQADLAALQALADHCGGALARIQSREAQRASAAKFRTLIERMGEGLLQVDEGDIVRFVNPQLCRMLGYSEAEMIGQHAPTLLNREEDRPAMIERNRQRQQGLAENYEMSVRKQSGELLLAWISATPVTTAEGKLSGSMAILTDITERKRAEAALRESEARFQSFMNQSPVVAWVKDEQFKYRYVNAAFEQLFAQPAQELFGRTDYEVYAKTSADQTRANDVQVLASDTSLDTIEEVPGADGKLRRWLVQKFPLHRPGRPSWVGGTAMDVTDRVEAQELLRENEERFRLLFEGASDAIFWADAETGLLTHCNRAAETLLGRDRAEIIGQPQASLHPAEDAARYREIFQVHADSRSKAPVEMEVLRKDGQRVPVSISPSVTVIGGKPVIQGIFRDISRDRWLERLLEWEKKSLVQIGTPVSLAEVLETMVYDLERLAPESLCSILLLDEDGVHLRHGAAPSLPRAYNELIDGVTIGPGVGSCGTAAFTKQQVIVADIAHDPLWADFRDLAMAHGLAACWSTPIQNNAGKVLGTFAIYYRQPRQPDVAMLELFSRARHLAALAIERKQAELSRLTSEQLLDRVVRNINDVLIVDDLAGRVVFANQKFFELFGIADQRLDGIRIEDYVAPECRARQRELHDRRVRGEPVPDRFECEGLRRDGTRVWIEVSVVLVMEQGRIAGTQSVFRDITARRSLEEQLRQSQKMEAIGQLAGGIAHDFNNILGAIVGNVELARTMPPDDPELPASLSAIHTASQRAAGLVKQILAFSRRQEQQRQPLQLAMLVREAVKLLRATVPAGVEFQQHLATVPTVLADPSAIHQVAMNLCTNAWHALGDRPGVIRVELAETMVDADFARIHPELRPGPYVQLTVADTGCGMDAATLAHIFEPFFTTKPVGAGTGLGLAVVHGIMRTHDGGIVVTSEPGVGTTFDLYFPVFEAAVPDSPTAADPIANGAGEHILFVDDEEALGKVGRNILMRMGYRVTVVSSPAEALTLFQAQPAPFDLVITDNNMPGMSGTLLGAQLLASHPGQRIILTTGFSANVTEETARAMGFAGLLPKPYNMRSLSEAVQAVLQAAKNSR